MFRRTTAVFAFACLVWVTSPSGPSAQTRRAGPQARPIFQAGVESAYVTTAVLVTDKNNKPVKGLQITDFEISEGGVRQAILDFDYISIPTANRPVDLKAEPALEPDVASNPPAARTSRAFVFVIDDGTLRPADIVPLKRVMRDFLKKLTPDDEAAVVYIRRSDLGVDFTRDVGQLIRGVNNINEALGWNPDARASKEVLTNVIDSLAKSPQTRRTVIYVSSGFGVCAPPVDGEPRPCVTRNGVFAQGDLFGLLGYARYADVPIYTIDPKGLASPMDDLGFSGHLEDQTPEKRRARVINFNLYGSQQFLRTVADATGGRGFVRQSNLGWAVDQIVTDNSNYYVLGYSPAPFVVDGKFHPIDVEVRSQPDLQVRARQGYVAQKATVIADPAEAVMHTLENGQPQGDLALRVFAAPMASVPDGVRTVLTIDVEYPALPNGETRSDDELQIAILAIDSDANVKFSNARTRNVTFTQAGTGTITVPVDETVDLPKGQLTLRIGVTSQAVGRSGTVHLPIDVRSLSGKGPSVTPLVLGVDAVSGLVPSALPDSVADLVPFRPTTRRTFSRDEVLQLFTRVFATDVTAVTSRLLLKDGEKVVRVVPLEMKPAAGVPNAMDFRGRIDLSTLPAGTYVLELGAGRDRDKPATRALSFRVQ